MFDKKEYMKEWRKNNPEYNKQYYKFNHEKIKEQNRQWQKNHPEKVNEKSRRWRKNNPEYTKEYNKKYYIKNRDNMIKYQRENYKNNREECIKRSIYWRQGNSEKVKEYNKQYSKNRCKIDLRFNLNHKIKTAIGRSLKSNKKGRHWETLVGYDFSILKKHLQKTIPDSYTWQDYMEGKLHLDHKIPISAFNFTKPEHIDFKRCWALNNLRLLPAKENYKKNDKLYKPFQPALQI